MFVTFLPSDIHKSKTMCHNYPLFSCSEAIHRQFQRQGWSASVQGASSAVAPLNLASMLHSES